MKHIAIILLAVLPALVGRAQDTVQSPLMGNYYMETTPHLEYNWRIEWVDVWGDACGVVTKEVVPKGVWCGGMPDDVLGGSLYS